MVLRVETASKSSMMLQWNPALAYSDPRWSVGVDSEPGISRTH